MGGMYRRHQLRNSGLISNQIYSYIIMKKTVMHSSHKILFSFWKSGFVLFLSVCFFLTERVYFIVFDAIYIQVQFLLTDWVHFHFILFYLRYSKVQWNIGLLIKCKFSFKEKVYNLAIYLANVPVHP